MPRFALFVLFSRFRKMDMHAKPCFFCEVRHLGHDLGRRGVFRVDAQVQAQTATASLMHGGQKLLALLIVLQLPQVAVVKTGDSDAHIAFHSAVEYGLAQFIPMIIHVGGGDDAVPEHLGKGQHRAVVYIVPSHLGFKGEDASLEPVF